MIFARWTRLLLVAGCLGAMGCGGSSIPPRIPWTNEPGSFFDPLDAFDPAMWAKADGWANAGQGFNVGWRADHAIFTNGVMNLQLDTQNCPSGCAGKPYASDEVYSHQYLGYGRFEARMKPGRGSGTVSSFITHTGPSEDTRWDEIDIEFLGRDTTKFQTNYWTNGVGGHEAMVDLPFDAADDFHTFGFEWTRDSIKWYADGQLVHTETGTNGPLPTQPGKIIVNFWPALGIEIWTGPFTYPGSPMLDAYDSFRFGPAAHHTVLDDFEDSASLGAWAVATDGGASLTLSQVGGHIGSGSMQGDYAVTASGHAGVSKTFTASQDWSSQQYFNFWFHGTGSGNSFRAELQGPRAPGSTTDTAERFEYVFTDDAEGWKWYSLPWSQFTRRVDWQPQGAPTDKLTLTQMWGYGFAPLGGSGSFRVDQVDLERPFSSSGL